MPYSNFTLKRVKSEFNLEVVENKNLFSNTTAVQVSEYLSSALTYNVPLALAINTEKARSELIISQILIEVKRLLNDKVGFFSGINFDVDKDKDLSGFCDYILSKSSEQFYLSAPIIAIVEAKNENIIGGLGQCIAEMIAAKLFNEKEGDSFSKLYGAVTTGNTWKFLKYQDDMAYIDVDEYYISNVNKIVGILTEMVNGNA